jgi:excisionase family DNA binding protein
MEILNPAQVAQMLGVTEADVLATIESGELKAKKIGTAWRINRAALDQFLAH